MILSTSITCYDQFSCVFFYQAISILEGLIPKKEDGSNVSASHLERLYIFCVMWSVGALLELDDRAKMEEFTRANFELDLPPIAEGSQDTIFEFLVNEAGSCYVLYFYLRCVIRRGTLSREENLWEQIRVSPL